MLVGLGMVSIAVILWLYHEWEMEAVSKGALNERQQIAKVLAEHLDYVLQSNLILLQDVALDARLDSEKGGLEPVKSALRDASLRSIFNEGVFILDDNGNIIWMEPRRPAETTEKFSLFSPLRQVFLAGKPEVSNLIVNGEKRIYAAVPIRDWHGKLKGAVGGEIDPQSSRFRSLFQPIRLGDATTVEIVDGHGIVLVSTNTARNFARSEHGRLFEKMIEEHRAMVETCRGCHNAGGLSGPDREVLSFVPLTVAPWGISIQQAGTGSPTLVFGMERGLLLVGSVTIIVALLFAWGAARSVTKPLGVLSRASERIADRHLDEPIPSLGEDEIGRLARTFDRMREELKASIEAIDEGKRGLERKVQERTRELEVLYREVQRKEEMRGDLLKKVIGAQEEERKRIARELHDETSQDLATLLLSIETQVAAAPEEIKERLLRMKAMAGRTLDSIHRLIFDLRPAVLDDLGLPSALRWSAESRLEPMGIDLDFRVEGRERRLSSEIETTLFRIGQEAISNIARHAEAESVGITVTFGEDHIRLRIEDDGKGFDQEMVGSVIDGPRGLGLLGMRERASLLSGNLVVQSGPGKGTRLEATISLLDDHTKERPA